MEDEDDNGELVDVANMKNIKPTRSGMHMMCWWEMRGERGKEIRCGKDIFFLLVFKF